ncbi:MAG: ATP-dependent Clp protease adaptor protein ClpS [Bacteroidetes bacterium ADurb.Bin408]|nr:MAG: ATP-dependent Clp protease adaptor protein ClpS [Bacteroidetes bacterium ADurb.Bin408]
MVKEKTKSKSNEKENHGFTKEMILHNDDFNTFDYVIDTLVEVCNHEPLQAEQCAFIVHYKGRCSVKSGNEVVLYPMCKEMLKRGLTVTIE